MADYSCRSIAIGSGIIDLIADEPHYLKVMVIIVYLALNDI